MKAAADWIVRRVRLYRPDRNPLRRGSDRWEALAVAAGIVLVLTSFWPIASVTATVYGRGLQAEQASRLRAPVTITLVDAGGGRRQWVTSTGAVVTGRVVPMGRPTVGARERVWLDGANVVTIRPRDHAETVLDAGLVAAGLETGLVFCLFVVYLLLRFLLDRRRDAQWSAAWLTASERWRRPHQT
ncbi:hypothetical protein [Microbispora sp. NPDC049125]|uniref:hypothetical protein n=1 Tax=Microbispora sp. NPDC049125 TaxID=3154929 RepID=UPI0034652181